MCIWKHWKTPRKRAKNLMKLGVSRRLAYSTAYAGHHVAKVCKSLAVSLAINNKRLASFGLVSMLDYYNEKSVTCQVD